MQLTDNEAAATVALAAGIDSSDDLKAEAMEQAAYTIIGSKFDDLPMDIRPIP